MGTTAGKKRFAAAVNFRAEAPMVAELFEYQRARQLREFSDAAREVMGIGLRMAAVMAETRAFDVDPVAAVRAAIEQKIAKP